MPRPRRTVDTTTGEVTDAQSVEVLSSAMNVMEAGFDEKPLAWKIARIRGMVGNIPKTGFNSFHRYNYTTESDLVSRIGPFLAAAGIVIIPSVESHELVTGGGKDGNERLTVLTLKYTVTDGKESFSGNMVGYGADTGDKGAYKAITGAMKYVLMKLFLVDTGDDPEADTKTDQRAAKRVTAREVPPLKASGFPAPEPEPVIEDSKVENVGRGAKTAGPSQAQLERLGGLMRDYGWKSRDLLPTIAETLGDELQLPEEPSGAAAVMRAYIDDLSGEDMGRLIEAVEALGDDNEGPESIPYS